MDRPRAVMFTEARLVEMRVEVTLLTKVTVENWTIVKVVGMAVLIEVDTEVTVCVSETVS